MAPPKGEEKPDLDAVMINLLNGTTVFTALKEGKKSRVLDVKRFEFRKGIDDFLKKDLKNMLNEMEIYGNTQRVAKDDYADPILKTLKSDRDAFEKAVRDKDYGLMRTTFTSWKSNL